MFVKKNYVVGKMHVFLMFIGFSCFVNMRALTPPKEAPGASPNETLKSISDEVLDFSPDGGLDAISNKSSVPLFGEIAARGQERRIGSIIIDEGSLVSVNMVRAALAFHEGAVFSEEAVTQTVKNLEASGYFKNVKIFKREVSASKVDILIQLEEKSLLVGYEFSGNTQISAKKLAETIGLKNAKTVSLHDIRHFKNCILNEYRRLNYLNAGVEIISSVSKDSPKKVYLRIECNEGAKVVLKDVKFLGCQNV